MTEPLCFSVPATCANLGPGFGVLAAALGLPLTITVHEREQAGHEIDRLGTVGEVARDARHDVILRGMHSTAEVFKIRLPAGLWVVVESEIPPASGLGTISAGFAAGIGIAVRYTKTPPPSNELLDLLVSMGGDPAHGAAALLGGLTATIQVSDPSERRLQYQVVQQTLHESWCFVLACPAVRIPTADARRILPPTMPHAVSARTTGRVVGLMRALANGDETDMEAWLRDELHVPFRRQLVPGMEEAMEGARQAGAAGATISGHGPGIVALTSREEICPAIAQAMAAAFRARGEEVLTIVLRTCGHGALPTS